MLPVSIIIPCYNAAATLARTLDSCVIQPEAAQIIVVDDGSTDGSIGIVRRYGERDARIGLLQMPVNGGAARARNWGAMHATQPLLAFIDADDEYAPGALSVASGFLQQVPSAASIRLDVEYTGFPAEISEHPLFEECCAALSNRTKQLDHSQAGLRGAWRFSDGRLFPPRRRRRRRFCDGSF
jgi:glycosyltransferase involved in cell wall biosynthesis